MKSTSSKMDEYMRQNGIAPPKPEPITKVASIMDAGTIMRQWEKKGYASPGELCSEKVRSDFEKAGFEINTLNERYKNGGTNFGMNKLLPLYNQLIPFFDAYESKDFKKGKEIAKEIIEFIEK